MDELGHGDYVCAYVYIDYIDLVDGEPSNCTYQNEKVIGVDTAHAWNNE